MKFLFFSDAQVFGGHERVCLDIARAISRHGSICFAFSNTNVVLKEHLARSVGWIKPVQVNARHKRAALYFAPFRVSDQNEILQLITAERPDVILLCQGRIETCAPQMLALWRAKIPFVSVLPFAHAVQEIKPTSRYRRWENIVRFLYYKFPSAFIVPSDAARRQLLARGAQAPIHILPNVLNPVGIVRAPGQTRVLRCIGRNRVYSKTPRPACQSDRAKSSCVSELPNTVCRRGARYSQTL